MAMLSAGQIDRLFHALADPTRRAILDRLCRAPTSVSRLAEPLGVTVTAVAQHLAVLEGIGLVKTEKVGRVRTCSVAEGGFALLQQWIDERKSLWDVRLDALGRLLAEEDEEA
jgi:DNA-binding transcriptional ArsR family regulator